MKLKTITPLSCSFLGCFCNGLEFAFYKHIKPMGNLATRVLGGSLRVGMESSATSMRFLEELLKIDPQFRDTEQADPANADCFKEVTLQIYQDDGHPFRTYRLLDGHIANFSELFSATHRIGNTNSNHLVYIAFASATQVINDSTKNQFEWYITPFKPKEYQPAVKAFEGEEAQVFRKYQVDIRGNINLCQGKEENVGEYDILMNQKGAEIKVKDTSILPELCEEKSKEKHNYHGWKIERSVVKNIDGKEDLFKLFLFCSNSCKVEWSLYKVKDSGIKYSLGTYCNSDVSPSRKGYGLKQIIGGVHSHPNIEATKEAEEDSMFGDKMNSKIIIDKHGKVPFFKWVYFTNSKRLYKVGQNHTKTY